MKKTIIIITLITLALFIVLEGAASWVYVVHTWITNPTLPLAERSHTQFDPELGWINTPGKTVKDIYDPKLDVHINTQGVRAFREYTPEEPKGTTRIICSGDSFTFGVGVSDEHTWPYQLDALSENIETINMGQGGYALDQAYLWYERDGHRFEHSVHILALIFFDIERMKHDNFLRYPKPVLDIIDDTLTPTNVPLPERGWIAPLIIDHIRTLKQLRVFSLRDLFRTQKQTSTPATPALSDTQTKNDERLARLTERIITTLDEKHRKENRTFIVLYLPTKRDYNKTPWSEKWRARLHTICDTNAVTLIDLTDMLKQYEPHEMKRLFISENRKYGAGHYSEEGNRFVARQLHAYLQNKATNT